ncbi:MAG: carbon-nitrogen hydrolase family protein [Treponema sp.]|nr:carbon-nitrogen hydrolase family protein [Treponema sp.]
MKIKMATVCMNVQMDKKANLEKYLKYIDEAASNGANLVVFPEQSLQAYLSLVIGMDYSKTQSNDFAYQYRNAETVPDGPSVQAVIKKAMEKKIYVVFGMTEKDSETSYKLYNTAVLVGPDGYVGKYRKVHQPADELHVYYGGDDFPVFDTAIGKIGMLICYDKWFPESTRELALKGAQIMILPTATAWDDPDAKDYENDYAYYTYAINDRIRALENQTFFISSNQIGPSGKSVYFGYSSIVTPDGKIGATTADKEGLAYYTTEDLEEETYLAKSKFAGLSFLKDRKPGAYKNIAVPVPSSNYC